MDRPIILNGDLVVLRSQEPEVYQVQELRCDLYIHRGEKTIEKGTLVLDYVDCEDFWYNYCLTLKDYLWKITQIYRKENDEYKLIWKKVGGEK